MSRKELSRADVIQRLLRGEINGTDASKQLRLTVRHIRNLKRKVKKGGIKCLIHGNRGKPGNRTIDSTTMKKAKTILKKKYSDFWPTHAMEKLDENHGISLSKETVRQIMITDGLWTERPRKANGEYRSWRPRKEQYGEMIQFDGSYHAWLESRGSVSCLLAGIDDATGKPTHCLFTDGGEGVIPVFSFWKEYIETHGKPLAIYLDRHSTYKVNTKSLFNDPSVLTQFERAMKDLDIRVIHAGSPQAKGRVERLFGTLQNRLVKDMRLAGISSLKDATLFTEKIFLPPYCEKFSVAPSQTGDLHRPLNATEKKNLDRIFSRQETRKVNNDFTISYKGQWFQLAEQQPTLICRKDTVLIEERLDGSIHFSLREKYLDCTLLPKRPEKILLKKVVALSRERQVYRPPADHPWRQRMRADVLRVQVTHESFETANAS